MCKNLANIIALTHQKQSKKWNEKKNNQAIKAKSIIIILTEYYIKKYIYIKKVAEC